MMEKIKIETELVKNDNLARGVLIEPVSCWGFMRESPNKSRRWVINLEEMKHAFRENDPPEYWSDPSMFIGDYIATTNKFPWMPSDISKEELPF